MSERLGHASIVLTLDTYSDVHPTMQEGAEQRADVLRALRSFVDGPGLDSDSETARIIKEAGIPEPEPSEKA